MVRSRESMDVKLPLITPSLSSPVAGALPAGSKRETSSETRLDMVLRIWDERSRPVGVSAGLSAIFQAVPLRRQESRKPRAGARESCRPRFTMSGDRSSERRSAGSKAAASILMRAQLIPIGAKSTGRVRGVSADRQSEAFGTGSSEREWRRHRQDPRGSRDADSSKQMMSCSVQALAVRWKLLTG